MTMSTSGKGSTEDDFGPKSTHGTGEPTRRALTPMNRLAHIPSHLSLSLGRPRAIHPGDCTVRDPTDCDFPINPAVTGFPVIHNNLQPPSSYTSHWFQRKISTLINHVLSSDESGRRRNQDPEQALQIHDQVLSMLDDLPPAMHQHATDNSWDVTLPAIAAKRLQIAITANAFLLAVHRRHSRCSTHNRSLAIDAALAVLQAQHHLCEVLGEVPYKAYMLSYYTIDAGLFLAAALASHPSSSPQIHLALQQALARLAWMAEKSPLASSGLAVLQCIYSRTVGANGNEPRASSLICLSSSSSIGATPNFSNDSSESTAASFGTGNVQDHHHYSQGSNDPFMGVTVEDYTLEQFLAQWS